jgi:uncharacterized protein YegL
MQNAFQFKVYYNPYISPLKNSVWGVVSVAANEQPQTNQETAISLICDVSGSMQGAKFNKMVETVEGLLRTVPAGVLFSVVVFDDNAHEIVPQTRLIPNMDREGLVAIFRRNMRQTRIFGATNMSTGIYQALRTQGKLPENVVQYGIFLSDGNATEPEAQLVGAVKAAADTHMHLCAYGYGSDWNPDQLTKMAQITNGWMPKVVPSPDELAAEFSGLVARMVNTVASDVVLNLWTPAGARILSLSQAYPEWVRGEAAPTGDGHTWVVPVPPMSSKDHRDFVVHIELANVGARVVACKPAITYMSGGQRIEEKGDQTTWMILQQTHDPNQYEQVHPVVAGYLGQGELAAATRAMTEALATGDRNAAERQMTLVLESAGKSELARKTAALGVSTVSLTDESGKPPQS